MMRCVGCEQAIRIWTRSDPGLYLRYHLFVAYLLDKKGISVPELLENDFRSDEIERELIVRQDVIRTSP